MDNNTIFNKTEKARQQIRDKTLQIPLNLRFLLTLIDGIHTVDQLQANHQERFGDITTILQDLVDQGLIEEKKSILEVTPEHGQTQGPSQQPQAPPKSAFGEGVFLEGKKLLISKLLVKIYGPMANSMLPKLNDCQTEGSLYTYTKELCDMIAEGLNKRKADNFWSKAQEILEK